MATVTNRQRVSSGERINAHSDPGRLRLALEGRGVRLTRQRRVLLEVMDQAERHLSADAILELAQKIDPNVHRVTVYRTLEMLKKMGLLDELDLDARAIEDLLYKRSGLLGVSGVSSDMRALLASDDPRARFAVELFAYRAGRELGSLAAAAGGLDALVFTAGIGEHAAPVREAIARHAAWLGVELDPAANRAGGPRISTPGSRVSAWVIPTNEELMIARHTLRAAR